MQATSTLRYNIEFQLCDCLPRHRWIEKVAEIASQWRSPRKPVGRIHDGYTGPSRRSAIVLGGVRIKREGVEQYVPQKCCVGVTFTYSSDSRPEATFQAECPNRGTTSALVFTVSWIDK